RAATRFRDVAGTRRGPAGGAGGLDEIGRASRARTGAQLGTVADVHGGVADEARGAEGVGRAAVARSLAGLVDVAGSEGRAEDGRALHVGRAGAARAVAHLGDVADAGGRPAHRPRGLEGVQRTRRAAVAGFLHVARAGRGPTDRGCGLDLTG